MDSVPGWVEVATAVGSALAGGAVGAWGAIKGPIYADRRIARREQARATAERKSTLTLVQAELAGNLAVVDQLSTPALASYVGDVADTEFNARRVALTQYLESDEFANLDQLYAQFRKLRQDRTTGRNIKGTLTILAADGRKCLAVIQRHLNREVEVAS